MPSKSKKKHPKLHQVQVYADSSLLELLEQQRQGREQEIAAEMSPGRRLTQSRFVCSILYQYFQSRSTYDEHHDGGWRGYWDLVQRAAKTKPKAKTKGRRT